MSPNILCLFCIRKSYSILNDCFESVLELLPQPVALQDVDDAEIEKQSLAFVITGRNSSGSENLSVNNSPVFTFCLKFGHTRWATLTEKTRTFFVRQSITVFAMLYGCSRVVKRADSTKLANLQSKLLRNKSYWSGCHRSVDPSAPTIQWPLGLNPRHNICPFFNLHLNCEVKWTTINKKEARVQSDQIWRNFTILPQRFKNGHFETAHSLFGNILSCLGKFCMQFRQIFIVANGQKLNQ